MTRLVANGFMALLAVATVVVIIVPVIIRGMFWLVSALLSFVYTHSVAVAAVVIVALLITWWARGHHHDRLAEAELEAL